MVDQAICSAASLFSSPRSPSNPMEQAPESPLIAAPALTGMASNIRFGHAKPSGCLELTVLKPALLGVTVPLSCVSQIITSFSWLYLLENQPSFSHLKNEEMTLFFLSAVFNAILQPLLGMMTFQYFHNALSSRRLSAIITNTAQFLLTTLIGMSALSNLESGSSYLNGILALHAGHYSNTLLCNLSHCLYYCHLNSDNQETSIEPQPDMTPPLTHHAV